jgi:hypothetical protein
MQLLRHCHSAYFKGATTALDAVGTRRRKRHFSEVGADRTNCS